MKLPLTRPAFLFSLALFAALAGVLSPAFAETPPPVRTGKIPVTYRIRAADKLGIRIFQEDNLSIVPRVDAKGTVNLTLIGELRIAGMTVNEAEQAIGNAYIENRLLKNPRVTITVEEYAPREVTIQGMVKEPKRYSLPLESTLTLLELVTKAGGFTDTAKGDSVRITRVLPDGTTQTFTRDVDSLIKGKKNAKTEDSSLVLEPDDIVYVPERVI
jgi:polysaccharide biosynthesis/export protein